MIHSKIHLISLRLSPVQYALQVQNRGLKHQSFHSFIFRISVVFRVRSAQRIKISDTDLIKRLILIVLLFAAYLTVRMVVGPPRVIKGMESMHHYAIDY